MVIMNIALYGVTLLAARLLNPENFGAFTALLGLIVIGNVVPMGIQAVIARRIAVKPERAPEIIAQAKARSVLYGLSLSALTGLSTVVFTPILKLDGYLPVILAGLALLPLTIMGAQLGIAQGQSRWGSLAVIYLGNGFGRLSMVIIAMMIDASLISAMIGIVLGNWIPALIGWRMFATDAEIPENITPLLREMLLGTQALFLYFALTSTDALIARNRFDATEAGLYAAGIILTKAALFLPQFVTVVAFPDLARAESHHARTKAAILVASFGLILSLIVRIFPEPALTLVGGDAYSEIASSLWLFALSGCALAVLHLLVFDALARRARHVVPYLGAGLAVLIGGALILDLHLTGLVRLVIAVASGVALALWWEPSSRRSMRSVEPGASHTN